jgi:hypothetical protein
MAKRINQYCRNGGISVENQQSRNQWLIISGIRKLKAIMAMAEKLRRAEKQWRLVVSGSVTEKYFGGSESEKRRKEKMAKTWRNGGLAKRRKRRILKAKAGGVVT